MDVLWCLVYLYCLILPDLQETLNKNVLNQLEDEPTMNIFILHWELLEYKREEPDLDGCTEMAHLRKWHLNYFFVFWSDESYFNSKFKEISCGNDLWYKEIWCFVGAKRKLVWQKKREAGGNWFLGVMGKLFRFW